MRLRGRVLSLAVCGCLRAAPCPPAWALGHMQLLGLPLRTELQKAWKQACLPWESPGCPGGIKEATAFPPQGASGNLCPGGAP